FCEQKGVSPHTPHPPKNFSWEKNPYTRSQRGVRVFPKSLVIYIVLSVESALGERAEIRR
ncbi:MAG: hypothetical protein KQJ78_17665, partial [Deltaproteobacteria bacterium]|nr:hypothetical protein [Deltaproteobacteria bacterium]